MINVKIAANIAQKARLLVCCEDNSDAITYIIGKYEALIRENRKLNQELNAMRDYEGENLCPICGVNSAALNNLKKACKGLFGLGYGVYFKVS